MIICCWLLQAVKELGDWNGQCPPTAKHQKGKIITPRIKEVIGKVSGEFFYRDFQQISPTAYAVLCTVTLFPSLSLPASFPPQSLPEFGPYLQEKEGKVAAYKASIQPVTEFSPAIHRPPLTPSSSSIPSVQVCTSVW